jgi:hypothetical protein
MRLSKECLQYCGGCHSTQWLNRSDGQAIRARYTFVTQQEHCRALALAGTTARHAVQQRLTGGPREYELRKENIVLYYSGVNHHLVTQKAHSCSLFCPVTAVPISYSKNPQFWSDRFKILFVLWTYSCVYNATEFKTACDKLYRHSICPN